MTPSLSRITATRARHNKARLADLLHRRTGVRLPDNALFDVHIKRVHEYKRQLLNILEAIALYQAIRARAGRCLGAAGEDFRRQGGGELRARQAHHQADQRRRRASSTPTRWSATG